MTRELVMTNKYRKENQMKQINVNELKPHPRNNEFFDDMSGEKWQEFLDSIKARGVIEPIVITPDKVIVSGHQRVRACKELGIKTVMCDVHTYDNEDQVLQDLIETNIRQRGDVGGSAKKVGKRIKELERIYGIKNGGSGYYGNQHEELSNNFKAPKTQEQLASDMGITVQTLQNYKMMSEMIPELEDLMDTGIVTKTTALAMMKSLSPQEQEELISSLDTTKRITQKEMQKYIDKVKESEKRLENQVSELKSEKSILETKVRLNEENAERYEKLQSDIDFLTKKKTDIGRQIDSATELAGLTVKVQRLLEEELAPIKFKRCIEELDSSDVCVGNLLEVITKIDNWSSEMKKIISEHNNIIVDIS